MVSSSWIGFASCLPLALVACGSADEPSRSGSSTLGNSTAYTLTSTPFEVPPGEERFMCQTFDNPFPGDVAIVQSESHMTKGSHHLFVFYADENLPSGAPEPCSGFTFGAFVHGAQTPDQVVAYPPGIGASVKHHQKLQINTHYVNLSKTETLRPQATVVLHAVSPEEVTSLAAGLLLANVKIDLPPNSAASVTTTCTVPYELNILGLQSHMHQHGKHFRANIDAGQMLYETDRWDEPPIANFKPALPLRAGERITFACDYFNDTAEPLTFGEYATTNEMCILGGLFYPARNGELWTCVNGDNLE